MARICKKLYILDFKRKNCPIRFACCHLISGCTAFQKCSVCRQKNIAPINADVLVCLRYYGIGPCKLEATQLVHLIWATIRSVLSPGAAVVIMDDRRYPHLTERVMAHIALLHDGRVLDLQEHLGELADQPVEVILQTPALSQIKSFVVFDSSLSYILAHHPAIRDNSVIFLGAKLAAETEGTVPDSSVAMPTHEEQIAQEEGCAARSFDAAVKIIHYYSARYAHALEKEGFFVEKLGDAIYLVCRFKALNSDKNSKSRQGCMLEKNFRSLHQG